MKSMLIAASGMRAQAERMRVIAENLAQSQDMAKAGGAEPYRRRVPVFETMLNRAKGIEEVKLTREVESQADFPETYLPGHPGADERGYVKITNVSALIEMTDLREAQRAYEANLTVIDNARTMAARTVDLLKG